MPAFLACGLLVACTSSSGDSEADDGAGGTSANGGTTAGEGGTQAGAGGAGEGGGGGMEASGGSGGMDAAGGAAGAQMGGMNAGGTGMGGLGGGMGGMASMGGMSMSQPQQPEFLWINRVVEWRGGSGFSNGLDVQKSPPDLTDPKTRYARGKTQVRVVVEEVSGPTALATCVAHTQHGWDWSTCLDCSGKITKPGTITCEVNLPFCFSMGREGAGCHGAGPSTFAAGPPKFKKHFIFNDDEFGKPEQMLHQAPAAATPFKAKYQIVFVPEGQTFSGWDKYPLP